jgi:hypothetical protein
MMQVMWIRFPALASATMRTWLPSSAVMTETANNAHHDVDKGSITGNEDGKRPISNDEDKVPIISEDEDGKESVNKTGVEGSNLPKIAGVEHNEVTGVTLLFHPRPFIGCLRGTYGSHPRPFVGCLRGTYGSRPFVGCLRGTYGSRFTDMVLRLGYSEEPELCCFILGHSSVVSRAPTEVVLGHSSVVSPAPMEVGCHSGPKRVDAYDVDKGPITGGVPFDSDSHTDGGPLPQEWKMNTDGANDKPTNENNEDGHDDSNEDGYEAANEAHNAHNEDVDPINDEDGNEAADDAHDVDEGPIISGDGNESIRNGEDD